MERESSFLMGPNCPGTQDRCSTAGDLLCFFVVALLSRSAAALFFFFDGRLGCGY